MIPMTNKEIRPRTLQKCCRFWTLRNVAIFFALHAVISTLLLPLTIRGPIGGQYGMLITDNYERCQGRKGMLSLTDMSFAHEMFLISLLFLVHLIGLNSVIKESMMGMALYIIALSVEICISLCWVGSVACGAIKSHVMSQDSLHRYCFVSLAIEFICLSIVMAFACYRNPDKDT